MTATDSMNGAVITAGPSTATPGGWDIHVQQVLNLNAGGCRAAT
jgi:hypothetical protein